MKRYVTLEEISDGKLYNLNDMVKADCHGCVGCSKCCKGMGNSITLDAYDVFRLTNYLQKSFEELLQTALELNVVDGVILPNLRMAGEDECCSFLDEQGRCSIHEARPGICRIFPLGRYYEEDGFRYFLQTGECPGSRSKVKVSKWIDTPNLKENQEFILAWHNLLKRVEEAVLSTEDDELRKKSNMLFLNVFFIMQYDREKDFYEQFYGRLQQFNGILAELQANT